MATSSFRTKNRATYTSGHQFYLYPGREYQRIGQGGDYHVGFTKCNRLGNPEELINWRIRLN
eukprot:15336021-Ditylum_brightwellii.AAC.1